jgi:hypothetical protein
MSTTTLEQIQVAIKRALDGIDGLRAQATETDQPPGANAPIAYPRLVDWTYDTSFSMGCDDQPTLWHFDIWVLIELASGLNRAQNQLNSFIAPVGRRSIKAALEQDEHLGGCVDFIRLVGGGAYGTSDVAGVRCLAASLRAEVYA